MKLYLDLCCLKRPFDDPTVPRIRIEAEAVLSIQKAIEVGQHSFIRSIAHDLENDQNPDPTRRDRVAVWLKAHPLAATDAATATGRTAEMIASGVQPFDAFHLAWAEVLQADVFVTVDDKLAARCAREPKPSRVRVVGPLDFLKEVRL
jgi:predicted nucleic acid-binding protein